MSNGAKTLIVAIAGIIGGLIGMIGSYLLISFLFHTTPFVIIAVLFALGISPIIGGFCAMRAGTLTGRFLERND